ncbi:hypothetical protein PMAYCL1PPCAC_04316, partial [Pristionchus mayeri]
TASSAAVSVLKEVEKETHSDKRWIAHSLIEALLKIAEDEVAKEVRQEAERRPGTLIVVDQYLPISYSIVAKLLAATQLSVSIAHLSRVYALCSVSGSGANRVGQ